MEIRISKISINLVVGFGLLLISSFSINAQNENKLGIRSYGSFLHTETVPNALFLSKDVKKNDNFELRKALRNHDIDILVLSNFGGSLEESLNIAGIIQEQELTTYLPKLGVNDQGICTSACSVMFFGGKTRVAESKLGVSQFSSSSTSSSSNTSISQALKQYTEAEMIDVLNETFETPSFVFERMFQKSQINYFNKSEMDKINRIQTPLKKYDLNRIATFINQYNIAGASLKIEESKKEHETATKAEPQSEKPDVKKKSKQIQVGRPTKSPYFMEKLVKNIQTELNRLKCAAGIEDGIPGAKTNSAIKNFLKTNSKTLNADNYYTIQFLELLQNTNKNCTAVPKSKTTAQVQDMLVCDKQLAAKGYGSTDLLKIYNFSEIKASSNSRISSYENRATVDECNIYEDNEKELVTYCTRYKLYHSTLGPQKYLTFDGYFFNLKMYLNKKHTNIKIRYGGGASEVTVGNCRITKSYTHKGNLQIWDNKKKKFIKNN